MDHMKRNAMLHTIFSENPDLAAAIREADEEGYALYGRAYVQDVDFIVLTIEDNLLSHARYEHMRETMTQHPSIALNN
jgi:hypothetical protein